MRRNQLPHRHPNDRLSQLPSSRSWQRRWQREHWKGDGSGRERFQQAEHEAREREKAHKTSMYIQAAGWNSLNCEQKKGKGNQKKGNSRS